MGFNEEKLKTTSKTTQQKEKKMCFIFSQREKLKRILL